MFIVYIVSYIASFIQILTHAYTHTNLNIQLYIIDETLTQDSYTRCAYYDAQKCAGVAEFAERATIRLTV